MVLRTAQPSSREGKLVGFHQVRPLILLMLESGLKTALGAFRATSALHGRRHQSLLSCAAFGGLLTQDAWSGGLMPEMTLANSGHLQTSALPTSVPQHSSLQNRKSFPHSMIQEQALTFAREKGIRPTLQGASPQAQPPYCPGVLHCNASERSASQCC